MMPEDKITKIGSSVIQHGILNHRIYLLHLSPYDYPEIVNKLDELASENNYSKIFAKVPEQYSEKFMNRGYIKEAVVPGFFRGKENGLFLGKFLTEKRENSNNKKRIESVLKKALSRQKLRKPELENDLSWRICSKDDVTEMSQLYKKIFQTYPFPIHKKDYLENTMDNNVVYFCIEENGRIVSLSSSEISVADKNVEMTDFATLSEYQGSGFATFLLHIMEKQMKERGIVTAYTIARAVSYGMNLTFAKSGYVFAGTLTNNTQISGRFESMNVWYKNL